MIATLFYSGEFTGYDVMMAERSLMAYALGLLAFLGIKVLAPGFYSRQDMKTPVNIAVVAMMINISLNILLMEPLGHAGLALATVIAATANAALLLRGLSAQGVYKPLPGWGLLLLKGVIASLLMGVLLWFTSGPTAAWPEWSLVERVLRLSGLIAIGALCYALTALLFGVRPRHLLRMDPHQRPSAA
jgi:putative peptidoglycan lipid II flippase